MTNYERLIATQGIYGHISRQGAGSPGSMEVLDTTNDVFNPATRSFVYLIMPGASGVKFSIMEEDGKRVSDAREGFTYPSAMPVTGRFNRLKVEAGSCAIYIANAMDYVPPFPSLGQLARSENFRVGTIGKVIVPVLFPADYELFEGEDLGFIIKIEREGLESTDDLEFGDILLRDAEDELVEELNAYGHANTELQATIAEGVATYYIAKSNTDLSGADAYGALKATATNLAINLLLKEPGDYKISVSIVEMLEDTNVLEVSGHIFATRTTEITVPEPTEDAEIISFIIDDQEGDTVIDSEEGTIALTMPHGTNVTALVAEFETSPWIESIKVGTTDQVSETTENDFTEPVVYVVTAEDGETTKEWTVTVAVAEAEEGGED